MRYLFTLILPFLCTCLPSLANAFPILQLDIKGGTYLGGSEESVVTNEDAFILRIYGDTDKISSYLEIILSIAITPKQKTPANLGSFTYGSSQLGIATTTVKVTDDMVFGLPPIDATANPHLGSHDVFETYFLEQKFSFKDNMNLFETDKFNVETSPLQGTASLSPGTGMYVAEFEVNKTNLVSVTQLHFDAYFVETKNGKIVLDDKAPFSHDGQTYPPGPSPILNPIPEPASLVMWGLGVLACGAYATRRRRKRG